MINIKNYQMVKKCCLKFLCFGSIFTISSLSIYAQNKPEQGLLNASEKFNSNRFKTVLISEGAVGVLITTGLQYLWYKKFPHVRFHFAPVVFTPLHRIRLYCIAEILYAVAAWPTLSILSHSLLSLKK